MKCRSSVASLAFLSLAAVSLASCATNTSGDVVSATRLQVGEWRVEDIAGRGVIDNSPATLVFGVDGRLSGNASCNRLTATYTLSGNALTIGPTGSTMMACPPALMDQERRLLDTLAQVVTYTIDETDTLILRSSSGQQIVARQ